MAKKANQFIPNFYQDRWLKKLSLIWFDWEYTSMAQVKAPPLAEWPILAAQLAEQKDISISANANAAEVVLNSGKVIILHTVSFFFFLPNLFFK